MPRTTKLTSQEHANFAALEENAARAGASDLISSTDTEQRRQLGKTVRDHKLKMEFHRREAERLREP